MEMAPESNCSPVSPSSLGPLALCPPLLDQVCPLQPTPNTSAPLPPVLPDPYLPPSAQGNVPSIISGRPWVTLGGRPFSHWGAQGLGCPVPSLMHRLRLLPVPSRGQWWGSRGVGGRGHLGEESGDHQADVLSPLRGVGVVCVQVLGKLQRHNLVLIWKEAEMVPISPAQPGSPAKQGGPGRRPGSDPTASFGSPDPALGGDTSPAAVLSQ